MNELTYQITAPLYFVGERVGFYKHNEVYLGEILRVETQYSKEHISTHFYTIKRDGSLWTNLIREQVIIGREQEAKSRPGPSQYSPGHPAFVRGIDT